MKKLCFLLLIFHQLLFSQELKTEFLGKLPLTADFYAGTDIFAARYFVKDQVFFKQENIKLLQFTDLQLGEISHLDILNPLKIVLFYKNTNTVVLLDNQLTEIRRLKFNQILPFKNLSHASIAAGNQLWVFNVNEQRLEVIGSDGKSVENAETHVIDEEITDFCSNFNYFWIATKKNLKKYNIHGVLLEKLPISEIEKMAQADSNLVFLKAGKLYEIHKDSKEILRLQLPEIGIHQFYLKDEKLYIYDGEFVHQFRIIRPKKK